jgi:hypothetical protein
MTACVINDIFVPDILFGAGVFARRMKPLNQLTYKQATCHRQKAQSILQNSITMGMDRHVFLPIQPSNNAILVEKHNPRIKESIQQPAALIEKFFLSPIAGGSHIRAVTCFSLSM